MGEAKRRRQAALPPAAGVPLGPDNEALFHALPKLLQDSLRENYRRHGADLLAGRLQPPTRYAAACHEAGHSIANRALGLVPASSRIEGTRTLLMDGRRIESWSGWTEHGSYAPWCLRGVFTPLGLLHQSMGVLAGVVGEELAADVPRQQTEAENALEIVCSTMYVFTFCNKTQHPYEQVMTAVNQMIAELLGINFKALERLARQLHDRGVLRQPELTELVADVQPYDVAARFRELVGAEVPSAWRPAEQAEWEQSVGHGDHAVCPISL